MLETSTSLSNPCLREATCWNFSPFLSSGSGSISVGPDGCLCKIVWQSRNRWLLRVSFCKSLHFFHPSSRGSPDRMVDPLRLVHPASFLYSFFSTGRMPVPPGVCSQFVLLTRILSPAGRRKWNRGLYHEGGKEKNNTGVWRYAPT